MVGPTAYIVTLLLLILCCNVFSPPQDHRFSDEIDKLTGYKTKSLLCMPIRNSDGEIIGVAQAINKSPMGALFTEDDEKVTYFFTC